MKHFYSIVFLVFCFSAQAQVVNIPDAALKSKLLTTTCASFTGEWPLTDDVDTDNDGEIQLSEALAVKYLNFNGSIDSAIGLEAFTNLTSLSMGSSHLTDFSPIEALSSLKWLYCAGGSASTINMSQMANLESFQGQNSPWTSLDFSQTKVVSFDLNGCNLLTYVNLKNGYMSGCNYGPDDGCTQWFLMTNLKAVCRDEGELTTGTGYAPLPWGVINSYCSFAPGGQSNNVTGTVTLDCGGLSIPMRNIPIVATEGGTYDTPFFANYQGEYLYYMGNGSVTITPQFDNSPYFSIVPPNYTHNFTTLGSSAVANFCLTPNGAHPDLEVSIVPNGPARPGFDAHYYVVYKNKGTEIQSGTIFLTFPDDIADFISASPAASQSGNQLTWNFSSLAPFETHTISLSLNLNSPMETPAVNIGDVLGFSAVISSLPDETPQDNTFAYNQAVVGSYDPNDKAVSRSAITPSQLDNYLYYTVRFQNTGTFAAENVVIKDMLSAKLDPATMEMVASSHTCHTTIKAGNTLEFFFEGINLPAEQDNEPASHGYVVYKIKPKNNLVIGNTITNKAEIYFDFNFPIVTNEVTTNVSALGIDDFNEITANVYPNPAKNNFTVELARNNSMEKIIIYNTLGQMLKMIPGNQESEVIVDVSDLQSGTYIVSIATDKGKTNKKLVKL